MGGERIGGTPRSRQEAKTDVSSSDITSGAATNTNEKPFFTGKRKGVILGTALGAAAVFIANHVYRDESGELKKGKIAKSVAKAVGAGVAEGMLGVAGITVRDHRELTHRSLEVAPWLQKALDFEQQALGIPEPYAWASVHRIHHQMTDASLFPFYQAFHAMRAAEEQGVKIPADKEFKYFDPFVDAFDKKTVMEIGRQADEVLKERMGDLYKPPEFTDEADIHKVLNPDEPQYMYPQDRKRQKREDYTPDDIARILLTDPHSPALVRRDNGVQGVAMTNISLYQTVASMFRAFPELKPEDLRRPEDADPTYQDRQARKAKRTFYAGFAAQAGAVFLANRDFSLKGLGKAVLEGAAMNGIRAATELVGGNVTNSAGHMGDPVQTELAQAFLNRIYKIKLKPDGSISTNTVGKGPIGRLSSWATLDEVGGQEIHHRDPWKIRYSDAQGREAVIEAPWGSLLEYLAKSDKVGFLQEGKGFDGPVEQRPDMVHPAVQMIQAARAEQYRRDYPDGYPSDEPGLSGGITRVWSALTSRWRQ